MNIEEVPDFRARRGGFKEKSAGNPFWYFENFPHKNPPIWGGKNGVSDVSDKP